MKRHLVIFLAVVMLISLVGCSSGDSKYTVELKDGTTKKMSAEEIMEVRVYKNIPDWQKNFKDSKISGTGEITEIVDESTENKFLNVPLSAPYYLVTIDDQTVLLTRPEVFTDLSVGDKIKFDGKIGEGVYTTLLYVNCCGSSFDNPEQHIFPAP